MKIIKKIVKEILRKLSRVVFHLMPKELHMFYKIEEEKVLINSPKEKVYNYYRKKELLECFNHFEKHLQSALHLDNLSIRTYAIEKSLINDKEKNKFYLEFGVFKGASVNIFADYVKTIYGFDSFEGLKEDWGGHLLPKGHFNLNKKIPKLKNNVVPVVGWIQDTLEDFLNQHNPKINFVHIDVDTYESSLYILKTIKPYLDKNAIILFDELYNFPGWKNGEYKALQETFNENEYKFRAFSRSGMEVAVQLI
tara:strand:- start:18 stop:773 length:756 start_codon:yes stop_codon:yes gene_type:complete